MNYIAYDLGKAAFAAGKKRIPMQDPELMKYLKIAGTNVKAALADWIEGWDEVNLDAPVTEGSSGDIRELIETLDKIEESFDEDRVSREDAIQSLAAAAAEELINDALAGGTDLNELPDELGQIDADELDSYIKDIATEIEQSMEKEYAVYIYWLKAQNKR